MRFGLFGVRGPGLILYLPAKGTVIEKLFDFEGQARKENNQYVNEVINLCKAGKIKQLAAAHRIARKLAGTKTQAPSGLALVETHNEKEPATGKLARSKSAKHLEHWGLTV